MSRRQLLAIVGALLVVACGIALVWSPGVSAAQSVHLNGRAQIGQGRGTPRLVLSATSSDATSYDLEATLDMALMQGVPSSNQMGRLTSLEGRGGEDGDDDGAYRGRGASGQNSPSQGVPGPIDPSRGGPGQVDLAGLPNAGQSSGQSPALQGQQAVTTVSTAGARSGDPTFWHIARAAGLSAYLMLFLNVFLGLAVHTRYLEGVMARWRSFDLHQFTALLAGGFLGLHVLALLGDRYMAFTPAQLVIPFASPYRPLATALGIVGGYMLLAVFASSYLRRYIGFRTWRAIHYAAFTAFLVTMAHGIFAGTDSGEPWAAALYAGSGATIALLMLMRFKGASEQRTPATAAKPKALSRDERVPAGVVASRSVERDEVRAA
jgi:hypothetical protein